MSARSVPTATCLLLIGADKRVGLIDRLAATIPARLACATMWKKPMTDDAAWPLAQHVWRTGYADLPASAIRSARRDILDTFVGMLGGSGTLGIDELCAVI